MTAALLVAAAAAILVTAGVLTWRAVPFTRGGIARRLDRPDFWEQVLAGRDQAKLTVFGPIAGDAMAAARRLGYDVDEPTTHATRTTFIVRRR